MKKVLSIALLLGSSVVHAENKTCLLLDVTIQNNTPYTCQLVSATINSGMTSDLKHLPLLIQPGTESSPFSMSEIPGETTILSGQGPNVTLSYTCGEGQSITIQSSQTPFISYIKKTTGKIIASKEMDANLSTTEANCLSREPGKIHWIFN